MKVGRKGRLTRVFDDFRRIIFCEPHDTLIAAVFDETNDEEIEAISAEIGASGARRPPSE